MKKSEKKGVDIEAGETLIWLRNDYSLDKQKDEYSKLVDYAGNGLAVHFGYDYIVLGVENDNKMPFAVAVVNGQNEAFEMAIDFNKKGLLCIISSIVELMYDFKLN